MDGTDRIAEPAAQPDVLALEFLRRAKNWVPTGASLTLGNYTAGRSCV